LSDRKRRENDLAEEAFRQHYGRIFRFLRRRTGSHHEAEELTQRVFADAAAALGSKNPPESVLAWLYVVAERRFIDELRRRTRGERAGELAAQTPNTAPPPSYGPGLAAALGRAIADLPADQREVVTLKLFREMRFSEIAEQLGSTEAACKMRFSRALATLRERLSEEGIEP
jgi:RNA polymerase sigma factor (sigma-70 family)